MKNLIRSKVRQVSSSEFRFMLSIYVFYLCYSVEHRANEHLKPQRQTRKRISHPPATSTSYIFCDLCYLHVNFDGEKQQSQKTKERKHKVYLILGFIV